MKFIKQLRNEKGFYSLEFLGGMLIFLMTLLFLMDLIVVSLQRYQVQSFLNEYARVVKIQSGVEDSMPIGFYGTNGTYATSSELLTLITDHLNSMNINTDNLEVWIEGVNESGDTVRHILGTEGGVKLGYRTTFTLGVNFDISWRLIGYFVPGDMTTRQTIRVTGVTEFKRDYDSWEAEQRG